MATPTVDPYSIEALALRAETDAHNAAMDAAKTQRDAWVAQMVCSCGKPATIAMQARWESMRVRPGFVSTKGGLIARDEEAESGSPSRDADVLSVTRDLWVTCERYCALVRIPGGRDAVVGWE